MTTQNKAQKPPPSNGNPHEILARSGVFLDDDSPPAVPQIGATPLANILAQTESFLKRFIAFKSAGQAPAIALWIAHSHAIQAFDYTPYLHVHSPEKRCGKSRTLDAIKLLVPRPWLAIQPSEAVIYRKIEVAAPTLLLDEVDTIFGGGKDENKEGLRALLNAGFCRGSTVPRCVGPNQDVKDFPVFCAKVLAGIGRLPDTVADRSVPIVLARKAPDQIVERFREREAAQRAEEIRDLFAAWAADEEMIEALRAARPDMPQQLGDRQVDICEPLIAIADAAGGDWPKRARAALGELFGSLEGEDESLSVKLLVAIRIAFEQCDRDRISTHDLIDALLAAEDGPWVGWWENDVRNGNRKGPAAKLARMLKPFGIQPITLRMSDDEIAKGYRLDAFADAWDRYLPRPSPSP